VGIKEELARLKRSEMCKSVKKYIARKDTRIRIL
jgi:hypothetical protein